MDQNKTHISEMIASVRSMKRDAEYNYKSNSNKLEKQVRRKTFSIYEMGSAVEVMADIKKLTDELYMTYESLVKLLDNECKPYLNRGASAQEIKAVMLLIQEINEDSSNISSVVSGDIGIGQSVDMRAEYYLASLESRSIQKAWENAYALTPESKEESRANARRELDKSSLRSQWKSILNKANPIRKSLDVYCKNYRDSLLAVLKKIPDMQKDYVSLLHKQYNAELEEKKKLGFFDFAAKKECNKKLAALQEVINQKSSGAYVQSVRDHFSKKIDSLCDSYISVLETQYKQAVLPSFCSRQIESFVSRLPHEVAIEEAYYVVEMFGEQTVEDIAENSILYKVFEIPQRLVASYAKNAYESLMVARNEKYGTVSFSSENKESIDNLAKRVKLYEQFLHVQLTDLPAPRTDAAEFEEMIMKHIQS